LFRSFFLRSFVVIIVNYYIISFFFSHRIFVLSSDHLLASTALSSCLAFVSSSHFLFLFQLVTVDARRFSTSGCLSLSSSSFLRKVVVTLRFLFFQTSGKCKKRKGYLFWYLLPCAPVCSILFYYTGKNHSSFLGIIKWYAFVKNFDLFFKINNIYKWINVYFSSVRKKYKFC